MRKTGLGSFNEVFSMGLTELKKKKAIKNIHKKRKKTKKVYHYFNEAKFFFLSFKKRG